MVKFNIEKMRRLIAHDLLLTVICDRIRREEIGRSEERALEIVFNSEVLGDSVLEREYNRVTGQDVIAELSDPWNDNPI